jgi:hypothetical protein
MTGFAIKPKAKAYSEKSTPHHINVRSIAVIWGSNAVSKPGFQGYNAEARLENTANDKPLFSCCLISGSKLSGNNQPPPSANSLMLQPRQIVGCGGSAHPAGDVCRRTSQSNEGRFNFTPR